MKFFIKALLFGAAAGGTLSCVEGAGGFESGEGSKAVCDAVIRVACQKAFECASPPEFESVEECISKSTQTQCPEAEIKSAEEDYKSQGKKVDLSALTNCEARYKEATCEDYQLGIFCDFALRHQ